MDLPDSVDPAPASVLHLQWNAKAPRGKQAEGAGMEHSIAGYQIKQPKKGGK